MNLSYELFATCTSIIVPDKDGNPLHCRTMDWDLPALRDLTLEVEFQRNGKTLYHATTWAGYVGILTGMRPGRFCMLHNMK